MRKDYCLVIRTKGGSISDKLWFETYEEAKEELEFYKEFYKDGGYKYQVVKVDFKCN